MSFLDRWRHRLRARFAPEAVRRERDAEVAFHLSLDKMHAERAGLTDDAARQAARRNFGNVTSTKEAARAVSRSGWLDAFAHDFRYAVRSLRRAPAYTLGAALTLALGIGATTAVFSIFESAVLRAVPYGDAAQLYLAFEQQDSVGRRTPSYPSVRDWLIDSSTLRGAVEGVAFVRGRGTWIDAADGAERVLVANVAPRFFELLRTQPVLGRTFRQDEELAGGERVVVLAFDTWKQVYGGDSGIVGRIITVDSFPTRVIGVMPPRFVFPQWGQGRIAATSMWMPLAHIETTDRALHKRTDHADSRTLVRITSDSARAASALSVVAARVAAAHPNESAGWTSIALSSVRDGAIGNVGQLLRTLFAAAGLVLLLACVNVANLSFVRGAARSRELAVRVALGAERSRVVRQLLTESVVVAAAGCALGLLVAWGLVTATRLLGANQLAGAESLAVNATMLVFACAVSVVAALASAVAPALRATRVAPVSTIRSGTQTSVAGRGDSRIRGTLVVVQLAIALILLTGTTLLARSFQNVNAVPLGYDPTGVVGTTISTPERYASAADALALYQALLDRVGAVHGVTDVGFVSATGLTTPIAAGTSPPQESQAGSAAPLYRTTSEGYLRAMGMQMTSGRWFTRDDMRQRDGVVLSEPLARQLFPNTSPLGQRVTWLRASRERPDHRQPVTATVIGVLKVGGDGPNGPVTPELYVPFTLETWTWGSISARTTNATAAIPRIRDALASVDPAIPEARAAPGFFGVRALATGVSNDIARRRLILAAIGAFALAALLLAAIGLYSVISYGVSQRTREVGVRIALGATNGRILRLVLAEGSRLAILGVIIGTGGALAATRLIRTMLFGTPPTDLPTYVATAVVLVATAALACYIPARRAARLSPTLAIKGE